VAGQERREVRAHADRAHARAAAAVRDAERLVQVQVADVGADVAGAAQADLRVHVRAVHVHLPAVLVHDRADLADRLLEHAVGRRVGDHQRREVSRAARPSPRRSATSMLPCSSQATTTTCMPAITALAGFVPCADWRDQADVRCRLPRAIVVGADHQQARVLALASPRSAAARRRRSPVISASQPRALEHLGSPAPGRAARTGAAPNSGQVTGIISLVALSFIVHEPSGIIECVSDRSRDSSRFM
jgi:hypothetical protein